MTRTLLALDTLLVVATLLWSIQSSGPAGVVLGLSAACLVIAIHEWASRVR